jgi:hypothetical protein
MVGLAKRPDLSRGRWAAVVATLALGVVLAGAWLKEARPPLGIHAGLLAWLVLLIELVRREPWPRFGPVFFYDLVRTTRRSRHTPLRCLYGLVCSGRGGPVADGPPPLSAARAMKRT